MDAPPARPVRSHRRPGSNTTGLGLPRSSSPTNYAETSTSIPPVQSRAPLQDAVRAFTKAGETHRKKSESSSRPRERKRPTGPSADPAFAKLESVLRRVARDWSMFSPEESGGVDFIPTTLALQLLDDPNRLEKLIMMERELADALQAHGQSNYLAFDTSVRAYHTVGQSLVSSKEEVSSLRSTLLEVKDVLAGKSKELAHLESLRVECDESEKILDTIEFLKSVPDTLESLLSGKRFRQAVSLLVRSLKTIRRSDIRDIGAVSDMLSYLESQETSLFDILIDELHSHLYLKSFYCESRWRAYTPGQIALPSTAAMSSDTIFSELDNDVDSVTGSTSRMPDLTRFLNSLSLRPSRDVEQVAYHNSVDFLMSDMTSSPGPSSGMPSFSADLSSTRENPESNSFVYIETLIESLYALGKLQSGLNVISQRIPMEIHSLVEETIEEVHKRSVEARRHSRAANPAASMAKGVSAATPTLSSQDLVEHKNQVSEQDAETLRDIFWTIYSKFDAVLQGFRVVYEISNRIEGRSEYQSSNASTGTSGGINANGNSESINTISLDDVWRSLQAELRSLLFDYLASDQERATESSRKPLTSVNDVLKHGRQPSREMNKVNFKISDSDKNLYSSTLKKHEDALMHSLRSSVPGLVSTADHPTTGPTQKGASGSISGLSSINMSTGPATIIPATTNTLADDREKHQPGAHRLLVRSDTANASIVQHPTQAFFARVGEVMPTSVTMDHTPFNTTTSSSSAPLSAGAVPAAEGGGSFRNFLDDFVMNNSSELS